MSYNKLSNLRLLCLVGMMRKGLYPNHPSLLAEIRKYSSDDSYDINQKTMKRDVDYLIKEYHAPIEYDLHQKGYYLTDTNWDLNVMAMTEDEEEAAMISARLAQGLLPKQVGERIRQSVDTLVANENEQPADERTTLMSLMAMGSRTPIKPIIFETVFQGWRMHQVLLIHYTGALHNKKSELLAEPHALVFYEGSWYLKVKVLKKDDMQYEEGKDILTLAVHRINNVILARQSFKPNPDIIRDINEKGVFDLPVLDKVRVKLEGRSAVYGPEQFAYSSKRVLKDGSVILTLKSVEEYRIMNFVLASAGEAQIQAPPELAARVAEAAEAIVQKHSKKQK